MADEMPPFGGYADPAVERAYDWIRNHVGADALERRFHDIEDQLNNVVSALDEVETPTALKRVSIEGDRIGWYLYLVKTVLYQPERYEPTQGARVVPIFKRLGTDLDKLLTVRNLDDRLNRLVTAERGQPDSALFEFLVAACWLRNGADDVELLRESPLQKMPDLKATLNGAEWFIECKRLSKSSAYSESEREYWLKLWSPLKDQLIRRRMAVVLDIVFHVELSTLRDDFLASQLIGKIPLVQPPCVLVSNEIWTVTLAAVDFHKIRAHLDKYLVKYPSDQVIELIGGKRDPNRGFTSAMIAKYERVGEGGGYNVFIDQIEFAAAAFWSCDAERSIQKKARDVRGHLSSAVSQLPDGELGVVHIGLETVDGQIVEAERYRRIFDTVQRFDSGRTDLRWVYCHLFQSYAPPTDCWILDETVYHFGRSRDPGTEPLSKRSVIIDEDAADSLEGAGAVHWLREPP